MIAHMRLWVASLIVRDFSICSFLIDFLQTWKWIEKLAKARRGPPRLIKILLNSFRITEALRTSDYTREPLKPFFFVTFVDGTLLMPFFLSTIVIEPSSCRLYIEKAANKNVAKKIERKEKRKNYKKPSNGPVNQNSWNIVKKRLMEDSLTLNSKNTQHETVDWKKKINRKLFLFAF